MAYTKLEVKNNVLRRGYHLLTSDYKTRNKKRPNHSGIDMIGENKTPDFIIAIEKGTVITSKYNISMGYYVEIEHENGVVSRYQHMKKGTIIVKKGEKVSKGQVIGYMGNTGMSTGAHLHLSILINKKVVDPLPYLKGEKTLTIEKKEEVKVVTTTSSKENTINYKVKKGDTLSDICKKYYGKYTKTLGTKIVNANKKKYPKITLDKIQAGWTLVIPK